MSPLGRRSDPEDRMSLLLKYRELGTIENICYYLRETVVRRLIAPDVHGVGPTVMKPRRAT